MKMKPNYNISLFVLLLVITNSVLAQQVISLPTDKGDKLSVSLDNIHFTSISETNGYGLQFSFVVKEGKLPRKEHIVIRPQLTFGDSIAAFPPVEIDGQNAYYPQQYGGMVASADWTQQASLVFCAERVNASGNVLSSRLFIFRAPTPEYHTYREQDTHHEDILHLQDRAYVSFPVAKDEVLPNFRNNKAELGRLCHIIDSVSNDSTIVIKRIQIKGFASPEGSYASNDQLASRRTNSLTQYVINQTNVSPTLFQTDYVAEDWEGLRTFVDTTAMLSNRDALLQIIDNDRNPDDKLAYIQKKYPSAYATMMKVAFPLLRHTDYQIDYIQKNVTRSLGKVHTDTIYRLHVDTLAANWMMEPKTDAVLERRITRQPLLAVKTNMLFYGVYVPGYNRWAPIPNIAVEYYPKKGHITVGASFDMPWWQDYQAHKYFQFRNYQLEGRFYLKGTGKADKSDAQKKKIYTGFYLQAYAHLAIFGICFDEDRGWVGEGIGAGVGCGYVRRLSKNGRWRLELGVQAGFFRCKYDPYQYENPVNPDYRDHLYYYKWTNKPSLFKKRQYRYNWIGPTRVGVTLSYNLLYRRVQKKGAGLKSYEVYGAYETNKANKATKTKKERRAHE